MKISTYFGGNEDIKVTLPERSNEIKEKVNDLLSTLDELYHFISTKYKDVEKGLNKSKELTPEIFNSLICLSF